MFQIILQDPSSTATNPFRVVLSTEPPPINTDMFLIWDDSEE